VVEVLISVALLAMYFTTGPLVEASSVKVAKNLAFELPLSLLGLPLDLRWLYHVVFNLLWGPTYACILVYLFAHEENRRSPFCVYDTIFFGLVMGVSCVVDLSILAPTISLLVLPISAIFLVFAFLAGWAGVGLDLGLPCGVSAGLTIGILLDPVFGLISALTFVGVICLGMGFRTFFTGQFKNWLLAK